MSEIFSAAGFEWDVQKDDSLSLEAPFCDWVNLILNHLSYSNTWILNYSGLDIEHKKLKATTKEEAALEAIAIIRGRLKELNNFFRI